MTTAMPHHTDLPAFAAALAEHSPDSWITAHRVHPDDPYAFPLYGRVWDAGEVDNVAGDFHLGHDALLTASDGLRPCVIERPRLPRQFLVARSNPRAASLTTSATSTSQAASPSLRARRAPPPRSHVA
ncbi:hypothetical protein ACFWA5_20545 [Streptomyces mirabilis]|uniref:hypothetical protein n=1 Tax=Streptomyces mirabilis TaxID=68239 RepID=UPI003655D41B